MVQISCVIPVRNAGRFLSETLQSVLEQDLRPDEVIVVDDGSTDDSAKIAGHYGSAVSYVRQDWLGPAAARNHGIKLCRGDFIAFIDADDVWPTDKLSRQIGCLRASTDLGICVGRVQQFHVIDGVKAAAGEPMPGYTFGTIVARRVVFDRVGLLNENLRHSDGLDWFLRMRNAQTRECLIPEVVLLRRLHPDSFSQNNADESRSEYLKVLRAHHRHRPAPASNEPSTSQV
jgi:glycosyltransferase involved in cell wall biosynthesis